MFITTYYYNTSNKSKIGKGWFTCSFLYQIDTTNTGMWCICTYAYINTDLYFSLSVSWFTVILKYLHTGLTQQRETGGNGLFQRSFWVLQHFREMRWDCTTITSVRSVWSRSWRAISLTCAPFTSYGRYGRDGKGSRVNDLWAFTSSNNSRQLYD